MRKNQPMRFEIVQTGDGDWLFEQRENQRFHASFLWEKRLLDCIRDGDVNRLEEILQTFSSQGVMVGKLSSSSLRQMQYLAVTFISLSIRQAMEGGMLEMDAYNKSDAFIQTVDKLNSPEAVMDFVLKAMRDLTREMREIQVRRSYSPPIRICLEYIYSHLHYHIHLKELANLCRLSEPYLSTLFKKEVGMNVSAYIQLQKIKTAQRMLLQTNLSAKEISNFLDFSSQSYFVNCFKQTCGITPRQYRLKERSIRLPVE